MYQDSMEAIHGTLIRKGINKGLTHTVELIPARQMDGQTYAFLCSVYGASLTSTGYGDCRLNKII